MSIDIEELERLAKASLNGRWYDGNPDPKTILKLIKRLRDAEAFLTKTENEPVAWMYDVTDIDDGENDKRLHFYKPLDCVDNISNVVPLYTEPPARKPLSDDTNRLIELLNRIDEDRKVKDWESLHIELSEAISIARALKPAT